MIREKDGWTQRALARAVGIRPATLCAIEAEDASAQMDTLKALAHAMHCPVDAILRRCEPVRAAAKAEPEPQGAAAA